MAKDITDYSTLDFIDTHPDVVCGQVLMDRHRHYAIVAKKARTTFHLICVNSGILKVSKLSAREITEHWMNSEYPYEQALAHLQAMCNKQGATEAAKALLERLAKLGKEPQQQQLFS